MYGSGAGTGMEIIHQRIRMVLSVRPRARTVCCEAATGSAAPATAGRPIGMAASLAIATLSARVFVWFDPRFSKKVKEPGRYGNSACTPLLPGEELLGGRKVELQGQTSRA